MSAWVVALLVAGSALVALVAAIYYVSDKVPEIEIKNSNFIVTGGSCGLGLEMALLIVKGGGNVVVISRDREKLKRAEIKLREFADPSQIVSSHSGDVSDMESISAAIQRGLTDLNGKLDVLISNAGITYPKRFDDTELEWFEKVMRVNYMGTVNSIKSVVPVFKEKKRGRVICVSSLAGISGLMGYSCYSPTKAAIRSLCEGLHQEYYFFGISFSVAFPGSIGTQSFYEEQRIKPRETLELELNDPILAPEKVATNILGSLKKWRFLVSASGLNSDVMLVGSSLMSPGSFSELISQIVGAGFVRLLGYLLLVFPAKLISTRVRASESAQKAKVG